MKSYLFGALIAVGMATGALADPIVGTWASETNEEGASLHVKIETCGSAICGTVSKVLGHEDTSAVGKPMIWDMVAQGDGEYKGGRVWAPDNDKTYSGKLLLNGDVLTMSGCALGGLVCRGNDFTRLK